MTVTDSLIAIVVLFVIAGGGIILIDALVLRRIRNQPAPPSREPESSEPSDEVSPNP